VRVPRPLEILLVLSDGPRDYPDLCALFPFSRARMSYLLRQLEEAQLVRQLRLPADRRRVRLEITDAGLKALDQVRLRLGDTHAAEDAPPGPQGMAGPPLVPMLAGHDRTAAKARHSPLVAVLRKHVTDTIEALPEDEQAMATSLIVQLLSALMISGQQAAGEPGGLQAAADRLARALWGALPPGTGGAPGAAQAPSAVPAPDTPPEHIAERN
jgi:DNA-binding MarR family transcriptional regulator